MFLMPMREIEAKFCKSEIAIIAWRSQEMSHQMFKEIESEQQPSKSSALDRFRNDEGEVDMRKMTGPQALKYLSSMGISVAPVIKV